MELRENEDFQKMTKFERWENERAIFKDGFVRMICRYFFPIFEIKAKLSSVMKNLIEYHQL